VLAYLKRRRVASWLVPGLLLAVAAAVRFSTLSSQALWADEGYSWVAAQARVGYLLSQSFRDRHPSLYYVVLHPLVAWKSDSEFVLRAPSAMASVAFLSLIVILAWRWLSPRAATWAAIAASFSSFELLLAQEARSYAILNMCWLGAIALYIEGTRLRSARLLLAAGIVNALLPALHAIGIVAAALHLTVAGLWLLHDSSARRSFAHWMTMLAGVALTGLAVGIFDLHLLRSIDRGASAGSVPTWKGFAAWLVGLGVGIAPGVPIAPGQAMRLRIPLRLSGSVAIVIWTIALAGLLAWARRGKRERSTVTLLGISFLGPIAVTAAVGLIRHAPVWVPRVFSAAMALFALGIAAFLERLGRRSQISVGVCLSLVWLVSWIPYFSTWDKGHRAAIYSAQPQLGGLATAIIVEKVAHVPLALFYFPTARVWFVKRDGQKTGETVKRMFLGGPNRSTAQHDVESCAEAPVETIWLWPSRGSPHRRANVLPPACRLGRKIMFWNQHAWRLLDLPDTIVRGK